MIRYWKTRNLLGLAIVHDVNEQDEWSLTIYPKGVYYVCNEIP